MIFNKPPLPPHNKTADLIKNTPRVKRQKRDLTILHPQTLTYLQIDRQRLQDELKRTGQTSKEELARNHKRRLSLYHIVERFFLYLAEQGQPTELSQITSYMIEVFIKRPHPLYRYKPTKQAMTKPLYWRLQDTEKRELRLFFARAQQSGIIQYNPAAVFIKVSRKLVPENLSFQALADCQAFKEYLTDLVKDDLLSPGTATRFYQTLLILLHDAEIQHSKDPNWPIELDDLFSHPQWIADWLNNLENRSISRKSKKLARATIRGYLSVIRHVWIFLTEKDRASENYYTDLLNLFRPNGRFVRLPGRSPRTIEALSEAEEQTVFDCIDRYSINPILRLRDIALVTTALETTIRMDGLNSMYIENFKELAPDIYVCRVRVKRSSQMSQTSLDALDENKVEWRDWYMSPHAMYVIGQYLKETGRNWNSKGPVWLTLYNTPLSGDYQKYLISEWLKIAGCQITRPHVLRHTGIERLVNKYNRPLPEVQNISQHASLNILLEVYAKRAKIDAFREVNRLFPADDAVTIKCQDLLLSIGVTFNEISARVNRQAADKQVFTRQHVEELLGLLRQQMGRLIKFLGREPSTEVVFLPGDDYIRLKSILQAAELSVEQILGYDPQQKPQTIIKPIEPSLSLLKK